MILSHARFPVSHPGLFFQHGRRVARGPGDLGFATTEAERRPLNVRGRWTSGGRPFSDDRSGAETVRLARTGVERRLRTLKNLLLRQVRMPFRHSRISAPGET